ncbi:Nn.00g050790.m01.CDS01 [Neocucurbitaria sp. VM-36]
MTSPRFSALPITYPAPGRLAAWCPIAIPGQHLKLDGLNNDILAIIVDFICDVGRFERRLVWTHPKDSSFRPYGSTLFSLSLVNRRMRAISVPELFRNVARMAGSIVEANKQLGDIEGTPLLPALPAIFPFVKCVVIRKAACDIVVFSWEIPAVCETQLAYVLPKMRNLRELSITCREDIGIPRLKAAFEKNKIVLPTITGLRIVSQGDWSFLVKACSKTEVLVLLDPFNYDSLMRVVGQLPNLKHLDLTRLTWCLKDIFRLHSLVPNIQSLALKGELWNECVSTFAATLGRFSNLIALAMNNVPKGGASPSWLVELAYGERESTIALAALRQCQCLNSIRLVGTVDGSEWMPIFNIDGTVSSTVLQPVRAFGQAAWGPGTWNRAWRESRQKFDTENFPRYLSFERPIIYRTL